MAGQIPVKVYDDTYEVIWQSFPKRLGSKRDAFKLLLVFNKGELIGTKEFDLWTDEGHGVIEYAVKSILRDISLTK